MKSYIWAYDSRIFTAVYLPLHGFIWNQHSDQLPVVGRALHRYRRVYGFKSCTDKPEFFFRPSFRYCLTSVHYREGRFHIHKTYAVKKKKKCLH